MNLSKEQQEALYNEFTQSSLDLDKKTPFEKITWMVNWIPKFFNSIFKLGFDAGLKKGRLEGIEIQKKIFQKELDLKRN
jgi:hypothetical protein